MTTTNLDAIMLQKELNQDGFIVKKGTLGYSIEYLTDRMGNYLEEITNYVSFIHHNLSQLRIGYPFDPKVLKIKSQDLQLPFQLGNQTMFKFHSGRSDLGPFNLIQLPFTQEKFNAPVKIGAIRESSSQLFRFYGNHLDFHDIEKPKYDMYMWAVSSALEKYSRKLDREVTNLVI